MLVDNPYGYGRIIKEEQGFYIVEQKDASEQEQQIKEVNSGIYLWKTAYISEHLGGLESNNASGEFYLTDLCEIGRNIKPYCFNNEKLFLGVNTFVQLEEAEHLLLREKVTTFMEQGVRFQNSQSVILGSNVTINAGTIIGTNVQILGESVIGTGVVIEAGAIIKDCIIEDEVHIKAYSYLEQSVVKQGAAIGPFAHLRPGADIGEESKIGNFVEVKKAKLERGVKVSHLSYVGDAEIGESTNIGCGFITCNYDGANKHLTKIGKNCFIGSDSQMIAPVELGDECYVGSGSTINSSMPAGSFAIARARQVTKENMARKFIKKKK
jgi:bifunctional UDP-N-acetylglucosamine pyrophosphorylase/glucosamine-1-phosphate N-acetyltransferase